MVMTSLTLPGCQTLSSFGVNNTHQTQPVPLSGSLQFRVLWPAFKTHALDQNTQRLLVGVYQGSFAGEPKYIILEAGQENALFEQLPVGQTRVFCLAFSADNTLINGDIESANVEANQRKPVLLDLQVLPLSDIDVEEAQALLAWANGLFPTPAATVTPPIQSAGAPVSPAPTATPGAVASATPAPTAAPPTPLPSPTPSPSTDSRGGFSGGSGGGSVNPTPTPSPTSIDVGGQDGGELSSEITIDDGAPRPDTVVIQ